MSNNPVHYELNDTIAILRLDDGKANAVNPALIQGVNDALDKAAQEARAVVLTGRPGRFSAGFDLTVLQSGPEAGRTLVTAGAQMLLKLFTHPQPVVAASTGHAIAAGGFMLLASDTRLGVQGDFKIGLNEVAIGMTLPEFGLMFARERLSKRHFTNAVIQARLYSPAEAVDVGFLDRVCTADTLLDEALGEARRLATLDLPSYGRTKGRARNALAEQIRSGLDEDIARLMA